MSSPNVYAMEIIYGGCNVRFSFFVSPIFLFLQTNRKEPTDE